MPSTTEREPVTAVWRRVPAALGLRREVSSEMELARLVEQGLPTGSIDRLVSLGFARQEVFRLVIPQRTFTHRKNRGEPLTADESDKAVRLVRATTLAERVFGNREKAWRWLRKAKRSFDDMSPIELLATGAGARAVEEELVRLDEGMFG